jgi:hypothetical protein
VSVAAPPAPAARRPAAGPRAEAEIEKLRVTLRRDDNVVGPDVAVHDVRGVRLRKRIGKLDAMIDGVARIQRAPGNHRLQRVSGHVLRDHEEVALIAAEFVHHRDVRMGQCRRRAGVQITFATRRSR